MLAGKSSGNEEKCLEDQLGDAKVAVGSAETELKQLKTKISHCEKELKEKTHQLMSKREEAVSVENELNARRRDVENVKTALESLPCKEGQMEALQKVGTLLRIISTSGIVYKSQFGYLFCKTKIFLQDRASELEQVQKLKDEMRNLSAQLANVEFTYRDPQKNFDRSKVKGVIAKLIKVKDSSTMTALEVSMHDTSFYIS